MTRDRHATRLIPAARGKPTASHSDTGEMIDAAAERVQKRDQKPEVTEKQQRGKYEPRDSRNVTGTAATTDGRWTNTGKKPPEGVPDSSPATAEDAAAAYKADRRS